MPVLEILCSGLEQGVSADDPSLHHNLSEVRDAIKTDSRWFHCVDGSSQIYVIGQWPSFEARERFLASPEKDKILEAQATQLDFKWMLHLDGEIARVPYSAPAMSIERLFVKPGDLHLKAFTSAIEGYREDIAACTQPYEVLGGWRIDTDSGKAEYVLLSGWESVEAHHDHILARQASGYFTACAAHSDSIDVVRVRNMER